MAVNSVDSNRSAEVDSRNKAESVKRESELNKKHADEIAQLQRQHYEKLKQLEAAHQEQMDTQREGSRQALTERDIKYQKDMEDMRRLNRDKITGLTGQYEDKMARTREAAKSAIESERRASDIQKQNLSDNLTDEIRKKDKLYQDNLQKNQFVQKEGMDRARLELDSKHQQEKKFLVDERNNTVQRLQTDLRNLDKAKTNSEKDLNAKIFDQGQKMSDTFMYETRKEREANNNVFKAQKEGFDASLDTLQDRYRKALEDRDQAQKDALDGFGHSVAKRQNDQINSLRHRLKETEDGGTQRVTETKRLSDLEKKHLVEQMKKNVDSMENQRKMAIDDANQQNARNIRDMANQSSKILHMQDVMTKDRMNMTNIQHEEELVQTKSALTQAHERTKLNSDMLDKQRIDTFEREKKLLGDYYQRNLDEMKRTQDNTLLEQRATAVRERNQALDKLAQQMRTNEARAEERMNLMGSRHLKEVDDIRATNRKNTEALRREYEARITGDKKQTEMTIESLKIKYESQLANQKEAYEEKIRQMQKNFDQEKIAMAKKT